MALSTDDQLEFVVRDDGPALARLFTLQLPARLDALAAMRGISSFDTAGMNLLREIHERGDGFRVEVDDPRYAAAVERLVKADAWGQFNLAEWVVHKGLAEVFTFEVCGPDSTGGWYRDVTGKVFDDTWDKVIRAFGTGSTFRDWGPYVLGDEVARRIGVEPVGIPHMGGYAV